MVTFVNVAVVIVLRVLLQRTVVVVVVNSIRMNMKFY